MDPNNMLNNKIAYLEFTCDQLTTELRYLDELLRAVGFPDGIKTLKEAAEEVIDEDES
ncbi:MAG: hypothetical protein ACOYKZ_03155 [Chlamydiia bacterium]